jgi:hypothetical protein
MVRRKTRTEKSVLLFCVKIVPEGSLVDKASEMEFWDEIDENLASNLVRLLP